MKTRTTAVDNKKHMIVMEQVGSERKPERKAIRATKLGEASDMLQRNVAVKAQECRS